MGKPTNNSNSVVIIVLALRKPRSKFGLCLVWKSVFNESNWIDVSLNLCIVHDQVAARLLISFVVEDIEIVVPEQIVESLDDELSLNARVITVEVEFTVSIFKSVGQKLFS